MQTYGRLLKLIFSFRVVFPLFDWTTVLCHFFKVLRYLSQNYGLPYHAKILEMIRYIQEGTTLENWSHIFYLFCCFFRCTINEGSHQCQTCHQSCWTNRKTKVPCPGNIKMLLFMKHLSRFDWREKDYFRSQYRWILEHFWCTSIAWKCDIYVLVLVLSRSSQYWNAKMN